jgi:uncharacterized damage-inducible protein DinB
MKKIALLLLTAITLSGLSVHPSHAQTHDRDFLVDQFVQTRDQLLKSVEGLSDAQMQFKSAPDRWSINECLEHIILVEKNLYDMEQKLIKEPANPEKRKDITITDEDVMKHMADRSHKAKAPEFGVPKGTYTSSVEEIAAFTNQRNKIIEELKVTQDDLRNHVVMLPNMPPMDAYQFLLAIATHSNRHRQQIEEVKADPAFPQMPLQ